MEPEDLSYARTGVDATAAWARIVRGPLGLPALRIDAAGQVV
jgi:hypothetical protein